MLALAAAPVIGSKRSTGQAGRQFPRAIREAEDLALNLMSDNGSQPTSLTFMREWRARRRKQAFTAYANPKGNANTERLIRTIKEELIWLREWSTVEELAIEAEKFVEYFNNNYLHSALNYRTPMCLAIMRID
jgi:putative transposase